MGFFLIVLAIIVISWGFTAYRYFKWRSIVTLKEYVKQNPSCKTNRGLKCRHCDATSIRNWGLFGAKSSQREFICNHCGEKLYRSE